MRMHKDNLLLSAVWEGEGKPNMKHFQQPTMVMLKKLERDGVVVNTTSGVKTIRASLLFAVFDLVAKAPALNMKQFNGYTSVLADAQRAESSNTAVNGIYGTSIAWIFDLRDKHCFHTYMYILFTVMDVTFIHPGSIT